MNIIERLQKIPAIWPVNLGSGANAGDYISLKNAIQAAVDISCGVVAGGGTCVVTMYQAKDVSGTAAKALSFTKYWMTGTKLKYTSPTGKFTVGETVTGAGGGSGVVYKDTGSCLYLYTVNATAFVDGETLTGGTSAVTATADGIGIDEDIPLPCSCSDTFTIPAVSNRKYWIEIDPSSLDVANGFCCVRVHLAQAGASNIGNAEYVIEPKHTSLPMLTAIYD
jgi:hypothetical protein